jgi:site-specific DNA-methyltransferase (adenine-specific)
MTDLLRPWTVLAGDCRETLRTLPDESIDAVVTDTPYGLSTLLDPPNLDREALWQKLISGAKESPIKTLMRAWLDTGENPVMKGRGFMGKEWDALVPPPNLWREVWRVLKPGAYNFAFGGTRTYALIEMSLRFADFEIDDSMCTWLYGQGFPKRVRLDLKIDQRFGKAGERPVTGLQPTPRRASHGTLGKVNNGWQEEPKITGPATPDAARFVGWDRALRPGWEPIIIAVKPLRGTVAENALAYGTGGLHVDACRLPRGDAGEQVATKGNRQRPRSTYGDGLGAGMSDGTCPPVFIDPRGGYPANVILDEVTAAEIDRMSGVRKSGAKHAGARKGTGYGGGSNGGDGGPEIEASEGGASRFFYTAKASSSERDAGLEDLPALTAGERCDRENGSAGVNGYAGTRGEGGRNPHPTVKPLSLMRWLCRLASPPGAWDPDESKRPVILDPFAGSGSTLVAGLAEGVRVVGCELDEKMADVARRRCQHAYALPREEAEVDRSQAPPGTQATLF